MALDGFYVQNFLLRTLLHGAQSASASSSSSSFFVVVPPCPNPCPNPQGGCPGPQMAPTHGDVLENLAIFLGELDQNFETTEINCEPQMISAILRT